MPSAQRILTSAAVLIGFLVITPAVASADPVIVERHEVVGPARLDGSTTTDTGGTAPTGSWCAAHNLVQVCAHHRSDGLLAGTGVEPGACAVMTTAGGATGDKCLNARGCLIVANIDQPQGCRT